MVQISPAEEERTAPACRARMDPEIENNQINKNRNKIALFAKISILKVNVVVFSERPAPASSKCSRFFILFNKINISMTESREQGYHFSAGSDLQWSPVQRLSNNK